MNIRNLQMRENVVRSSKIHQTNTTKTYLVEALELLDRVDRFLAAGARLAHLLLLPSFLRRLSSLSLLHSRSSAYVCILASLVFTKHCANVKTRVTLTTHPRGLSYRDVRRKSETEHVHDLRLFTNFLDFLDRHD